MYKISAPQLLCIALLTIGIAASFTVLARGTYQEPEEFLSETFAGEIPDPQVVWLTGALKGKVTKLLGHPYRSLRIRYWQNLDRSAWILEEIGKEQPITTGIVVQNSHIERMKVLVFRESRGAEVRYPFFTDQFKDSVLKNNQQLDHRIDNISGATLSVQALIRQAKLALLLDQHTRDQHASP